MNNPNSFVSALLRAWRSFMRRPAFFAIAVSSLAIALGLATTIVAQIDSLMHPYSPVRDVERVYWLSVFGSGPGGLRPAREDIRKALDESGVFDGVAQVTSRFTQIEIGQGVVPVGTTNTSTEYLSLVGFRPRIGRTFTNDETLESGAAIVGDAFWRRYYRNAKRIGDARFTLDNRTYRIVGVAPTGWERSVGGEVWLPPDKLAGPSRFFYRDFVVRLAPSMTEARSRPTLDAIAQRWTNMYGATRSKFRFYVRTVRPDPLQIRSFHVALIGAAIFILVIASANVSALMLARSVGSRRDQALRLALGAGRRDLVREVMAEISSLAVTGAVIGIAIAYAAMGVMTALRPVEISWLGFAQPNLSPRVFGGLFAAALVCITLSAFVPALYVTRIAPAEPLKEASGTTTGRAHSRFKLLVIGEMALAMILLFGASLISKTVHMVSVFDFGYEARSLGRVYTSVVAVKERTPPPRDTGAAIAAYRYAPEILTTELDAVTSRLRRVAGIRNAAWYARDGVDRFMVSDIKGAIDTGFYNPTLINVGPDYFATLGIPIVDGRAFTDGDRAGNGAVVLDSNSAGKLFPGMSAVGHMVKLGPANSPAPWVPVIGVAGNALHELPTYPEVTPPFVIYVSRQRPRGIFINFVYRPDAGVTDLGPLITRAMRDALPPYTRIDADKYIEEYESTLAGRRFTAGIFATLSLASLALATAGLFGVLSYAVSQRMREFAIRIALGARRNAILSLVMRDGAVMALGGIAIGAFAGMYAAFVVYDWLWGVYAVDAPSLIIAESVLLGITAIASALPALRATRANPAEVIRAL